MVIFQMRGKWWGYSVVIRGGYTPNARQVVGILGRYTGWLYLVGILGPHSQTGYLVVILGGYTWFGDALWLSAGFCLSGVSGANIIGIKGFWSSSVSR